MVKQRETGENSEFDGTFVKMLSSQRMKQIVLLLLLSLGGFAFADKIYQIDACAAKLEVPDDWKLEGVDGSDSAVPFLDQRAGGSPRRIHFNIPKVQAESLDSAMNGELDRIGKRSPGSLATREFLHDARKLKTRSGIDGLMARFSTKNSEGLYFLDQQILLQGLERENFRRLHPHVWRPSALGQV